MSVAIYTLTSPIHDEKSIKTMSEEFLSSLNIEYIMKGDDYSDFGSHSVDLIYVRTGGTENIFKKLLPNLNTSLPFYFLTSGKANSLAASAEILSYLRQNHLKGEIIHGKPNYITKRINLINKANQARRKLKGCKLGVIGKPSDWLISSNVDYKKVKEHWGIELIDIPMEELMSIVEKTPETKPEITSDIENISKSLPGANRIYLSLKQLVEKYQLQGFTIRCFDLLNTVHNTGCLGLAKLNSEGIVAGCEGDIPTMITMKIAQELVGVSGFQANPANIDPETGETLFAHCTIPLNMVERYELDTHFESGIGVAIRGYMKEGPVTIFKASGDFSRYFVAEGELIRNQSEPDLCRTQQVIKLDKDQTSYFLNEPIGNHHVILPGHCEELIREMQNM